MSRLDIPDLHFMPLSALHGENVVDSTAKMPWFQGKTFMNFIETVYIGSDRNLEDFRFPVQYVNRPHLNFRGFCGTVASGIIRRGDEIMVLPSRKTSHVKSIVTFDGEQEEAFTPQSITLTLEDEIDISRGDLVCRPGNVPRCEQKFDATIVWMSDEPLVAGKQYVFKHTAKMITGAVTTLRYRINVNTLHREDAPALGLNEIGRCSVVLNEPVSFDRYRRNQVTGSFIIIDRLSNVTVGAGMLLDRGGSGTADHWEEEFATSLQEHTSVVTSEERSARFGQKPVTVLLTGLSGAGKTTLAYATERKLFDLGRAATVLDGENLRRGISKDLGFTVHDRSENLRRGAEVARLMNDSGLICLAAFAAPQEEVRQKVAALIGQECFLVVHLDAPVEVCRERDQEGLYHLADAGEITNFPGVSAEYEVPAVADLVLATDELSVEECVDKLLALLGKKGIIVA